MGFLGQDYSKLELEEKLVSFEERNSLERVSDRCCCAICNGCYQMQKDDLLCVVRSSDVLMRPYILSLHLVSAAQM